LDALLLHLPDEVPDFDQVLKNEKEKYVSGVFDARKLDLVLDVLDVLEEILLLPVLYLLNGCLGQFHPFFSVSAVEFQALVVGQVAVASATPVPGALVAILVVASFLGILVLFLVLLLLLLHRVLELPYVVLCDRVVWGPLRALCLDGGD